MQIRFWWVAGQFNIGVMPNDRDLSPSRFQPGDSFSHWGEDDLSNTGQVNAFRHACTCIKCRLVHRMGDIPTKEWGVVTHCPPPTTHRLPPTTHLDPNPNLNLTQTLTLWVVRLTTKSVNRNCNGLRYGNPQEL